MKKLVLFLIITPTFLIGQSNQDAMVTKDTVGINEVEWIDDYTLHQKENNKPFTGVVKFDGELNYRNNKKGRFNLNNYYFSNVTFISGKVNGLYTVWGKESGQKKSEITLSVVQLSSGYGLKITGNGPYTHWYKNGQMATKGYLMNGEKSHITRVWYKNGQLKTEANYRFGTPEGRFITWDENGQKSYERYYYDGKVIRKIEWDENGNIVKEWPEVDEDKYGLKIFLNEFVSILKSRNYSALKKLFASKEDLINFEVWESGKEPSSEQLKRINEGWSEHLSNTIDDIKKEVDFEYIFKDRTISNVLYDYYLINEDKTSEEIKWPKSINYDLPKAKYIAAKITILLGDYRPLKIIITPFYLNNKWCFMATEYGDIVEVKY